MAWALGGPERLPGLTIDGARTTPSVRIPPIARTTDVPQGNTVSSTFDRFDELTWPGSRLRYQSWRFHVSPDWTTWPGGA